MNDEILYNKIYEQTKEFGRTHFIKEIMRLQRENQQLHNMLKKASELIKIKTKIIPLEDGGGLELCDYDIVNLLELVKESDVDA